MNVFKTTGTLVAAASFAFLTLNAQEAATPPVEAGDGEYSDTELLEMYGFLVASQVAIRDLELEDDQIAAFLDGFQSGVEGEEAPHDMMEIRSELQAFLDEKRTSANARAAEAGRVEADAFFAELAEREEVEQRESGLYYEIVEQGDGETPGPDDTVRLHYRGKFLSGETFDSSYDRGQPAEFPVTGVIPGMSEALQFLPVGTTAVLYIPPELGYGDQGAGGSIPPGSTLIFDIEILGIAD